MNSATKLTIQLLLTSAGSLLLLIAPVSAQQQSTIPLGERRALGAPNTGDKISSLFFGRRSYCCAMLTTPFAGPPTFSSVENFSGEASASLIGRGPEGEAVCSTTGEECLNRRRCWHEDPDLPAPSVRRLVMTQLPSANQVIDVLCEETTLVGGFNTVVTDFNFLELSATSRGGEETSTIRGYIILKTTIGGQSIKLPFTLDFNGKSRIRVDISLHDAINNARDFGQVIVIHNAAPGVLKARVSQYRIVTLNPLDFEPVLQEVLVPRVE